MMIRFNKERKGFIVKKQFKGDTDFSRVGMRDTYMCNLQILNLNQKFIF